MKQSLLVLILFTICSFNLQAQSVDAKGRTLPDTQPYNYLCKMIQTSLQGKATPFFIEDRPLNLDTNKYGSQWVLHMCTNCKNNKLEKMEYIESAEQSSSPWIVGSSMDVLEDLIGNKKELEKIYEAAKAFGCKDLDLEKDLKKEKRRIVYSPEQSKCINDAVIKNIRESYKLGRSSMDMMEKNKSAEFIDFYQYCHKEMNRAPLHKKFGDIMFAIKNFGSKKNDSMVESTESKAKIYKPRATPTRMPASVKDR